MLFTRKLFPMLATCRHVRLGFSNNEIAARNAVKIRVEPKTCLVDERMNTVVSGLNPEQKITLRLNVTNDANLNYASCTQFVASREGVVDLDVAAPVDHPEYSVADSMGMFWSMNPLTGSDGRFWSVDVARGLDCKFHVFDGHLPAEAVLENRGKNDFIAENLDAKRIYMAPGVRRIPVKEGRVRGTLFLPSGPGPFPAVIFVYGGILRRNVIEDKAAVMASRGFATLSMAFFGVDDLPKSYAGTESRLDLDMCEEAVDYLLSRSEVQKETGVGIQGISKGGEVALAMAAFLPESKISTVSVTNSTINYVAQDVAHNGKVVLEGEKLSDEIMSDIKIVGPDIVNVRNVFDKVAFEGAKSTLPFWERKSTNYAFFFCEDDQCYDIVRHMTYCKKLIAEHGHSRCSVYSFPEVGHLVDLPFDPPTVLTNHALIPKPILVEMGGSKRQVHARAQQEIWKKSLEFFRSNMEIQNRS